MPLSCDFTHLFLNLFNYIEMLDLEIGYGFIILLGLEFM